MLTLRTYLLACIDDIPRFLNGKSIVIYKRSKNVKKKIKKQKNDPSLSGSC